MVNEVAQALYKVFVFTNPSSNPLQKWKQGKWFVGWVGDPEGDQVCTFYVSIKVQEHKIKPRKGENYGWSKILDELRQRIQLHTTNTIETLEGDLLLWRNMINKTKPLSTTTTQATTTTHPNRFSVLSEKNSHNYESLNEDR